MLVRSDFMEVNAGGLSVFLSRVGRYTLLAKVPECDDSRSSWFIDGEARLAREKMFQTITLASTDRAATNHRI